MDDTTQVEFRTCPHCAGYGVRDNGRNCKTCGGVGSGGLRSGGIGSGEIMIDKATRRQIPLSEFTEYHKRKAQAAAQPTLDLPLGES